MNFRILINKYLFAVLVFFVASHLMAQSEYLANPSIDGEDGTHNIPPGWQVENEWSNPNNFSSFEYPDTDHMIFPVDGTTFALFRARGATNNTGFPTYTREHLYQRMKKPMETYSCFELIISLCSSPHYDVNDFEYPDTARPLTFQIWGGTEEKLRARLLGESDLVYNEDWLDFTYFLSTQDTAYDHILIEPQWDTLRVFPRAYNGFMLVDHLRLNYLDAIDTLAQHYDYYQGNNQMTLTPDNQGIEYHWTPAEAVSDPTAQSPIMTNFAESITVQITRENGCDVFEIFNFVLDCDILYPERIIDTVDFYFKYEDSLMLNASDGVNWQWDPAADLSAPDIQSPILLDFHEYYTVLIEDKYGCEFEEHFNIILHCDTVYPGGVLIALDTTLTEITDRVLEPVHGISGSEWEPPTYLSCTDCLTPTATPRSNISYSVLLRDEWECEHREFFNFTIPLKIPNVITPNFDDYNDCLIVLGLPQNTTFRLFDKTGNSICTIEAFENLECWAGTDDKGNPLKSGTYWYAFEDDKDGTLAKGFLFIKR